MKISIFILVFIVLSLGIGAQETGEPYSMTDRPSETELLLNPDVETDTGGDIIGGVDTPGPGIGDFTRMILVLGCVIALVYAVFWVLKRFSGIKAEGKDVIHLISTRPLKGDVAIHLIETGKRLFLIGSSGSQVNLLAEIDDKESVDEIRLTAASTPQTTGGFARLLKNRFASGKVTPRKPRIDDPADYLRRQKERLKNL